MPKADTVKRRLKTKATINITFKNTVKGSVGLKPFNVKLRSYITTLNKVNNGFRYKKTTNQSHEQRKSL